MNYLVTGGAGFIGSHLVLLLLSKGHEVTVIDNLVTGVNNLEGNASETLQIEKRSINDPLDDIFEKNKFDGVVHLAAIPGVRYSLEHPEETNKVNYEGTLKLLNDCMHHGVKRFLFASSAAVYGNARTVPTSEECFPDPQSPYAFQKCASEQACKQFYIGHKIETIVLRYFNVFGPRQRMGGAYASVIPSFISSVLTNQPIQIYGTGEQTRDFVYVADAVEAAYSALHTNNADLYGSCCNIGSTRETKIDSIALLIRDLCNSHVPITYHHTPPGPLRSCGEITRAQDLLEWCSRTSFKQGLRHTIEYFKKLGTEKKT